MGRGILRQRWVAALAVPVLFALSACGSSQAQDEAPSGEQITVNHAQGSTSLERNPEQVVVFDLGVLDTLDQLGVQVAGVPEATTLPESLAKYGSDDYAKVGTVKKPDFEKVNAADPDLIIVAGRSSSAYAELSKIAPTVDLSVDNENFLDSFRERTKPLGTIFGKEEELAKRLDALEPEAQKVTKQAEASGLNGLIVLTTGGKLSAYGPGSRFGIIHDELGVAPAEKGLSTATHGNPVSHEFIAEVDPDVLYVIDRDAAIGRSGESAKQVLDNPLVNGTSAAGNDRIVYLDAFTWYLAPTGLSSVEKMTQTVATSLS